MARCRKHRRDAVDHFVETPVEIHPLLVEGPIRPGNDRAVVIGIALEAGRIGLQGAGPTNAARICRNDSFDLWPVILRFAHTGFFVACRFLIRCEAGARSIRL